MKLQGIKALFAALIFVAAHAVIAGQAVNINTASAETLAENLDGVGEARAEAIVEFREENGRFMSADDLSLVSGIGSTTVDRNREWIQVDD
ncbi:competence protein ComEA [Natronospira proteinivora]|uniref:Competence protein ComEA n=1 Tax=Natronospira proteinivora TaxID=1807133 RepID=A0ABT1G9F7_9GAMM|nr:ComEA family DNA-binding protein [Natronospira proteinivora]MCP1726923.1 competence protein ComEA [Natronospira proteinivora]